MDGGRPRLLITHHASSRSERRHFRCLRSPPAEKRASVLCCGAVEPSLQPSSQSLVQPSALPSTSLPRSQLFNPHHSRASSHRCSLPGHHSFILVRRPVLHNSCCACLPVSLRSRGLMQQSSFTSAVDTATRRPSCEPSSPPNVQPSVQPSARSCLQSAIGTSIVLTVG